MCVILSVFVLFFCLCCLHFGEIKIYTVVVDISLVTCVITYLSIWIFYCRFCCWLGQAILMLRFCQGLKIDGNYKGSQQMANPWQRPPNANPIKRGLGEASDKYCTTWLNSGNMEIALVKQLGFGAPPLGWDGVRWTTHIYSLEVLLGEQRSIFKFLSQGWCFPKYFPKKLLKFFLRSFENVAPGSTDFA